MKRAGYADLPLHYGRVPTWLATRMSRLGRAIVESILLEYGKAEVLRRLSDPLWFQSFGCVLGMDWHSSGITTSVMGALKRSINPISKELGIYICGGRGRHSRRTPAELYQMADKTGLDGRYLSRCSRLSAKVDNSTVQDGFQIYLHNFIVTDEGDWAVVQQGMNGHNGMARRYHWHSSQLDSFIEDPHTWICGTQQDAILNLTDCEAGATRQGILDISMQSPRIMLPEIRKALLPRHHDVRAKDVNMKRLGSAIALAYEEDTRDFESLLLLKGVGPRTIQSLALVSEIIYGTRSRFSDPARFSFAHGGKDGHPFPVPTRVYDETINQLHQAVRKAKLGQSDKKEAIQSLHQMAKGIEKDFIPNNRMQDLVEKEWREAPLYGGRTTMDDPPRRSSAKRRKAPTRQLRLF
ncbi:MAG: DUF763 domain-containing protein [Bacteroidota bacterium]